MFKRTLLVRLIEDDLRVDVPVYIRTAYYKLGLTDRDIAEELGVATSTAQTWRTQLGLPSFQRHRREAFATIHAVILQNAADAQMTRPRVMA